MNIAEALAAVGLDGWMGWIVLGFTVLSTIASAMAAIFPDSGWTSRVMSAVNIFAFNVGKAKNDPSVQ